jgi:hypothetical protein
MVAELYILIWNRTKKPPAIAVSGAGESWGEDRMGVILPMYKINLIQTATMNSPLYNECILKKTL